MADPNDPCIACRVVSGEHVPAGGIAWRGRGFVLHAPLDPCPIPGWLVLTSERHARALYDLSDAEAAELGRITARAMRAQRDALGAEHVYAFAIGDVLRHLHVHLVPRFADTPARLRGRGCFDARAGDALPAWRLIAAVESVRRALSAG
ncbi:MAG TPA: HIT family protein [Anaeromyxobacteraceae bacterium]|nr:HIT family protein [Anaeromyxobacteraceae bacterium]